VPATAKRAIEIAPALVRRQKLQHLAQQDGSMAGGHGEEDPIKAVTIASAALLASPTMEAISASTRAANSRSRPRRIGDGQPAQRETHPHQGQHRRKMPGAPEASAAKTGRRFGEIRRRGLHGQIW